MVGSYRPVRFSFCVLITFGVILVGRNYLGSMSQGVKDTMFSCNEMVAVPV